MKAFGWIATKLDSGNIVKIIAEDGSLLNVFEVRSYTKAAEIAKKLCPKDYDLEWFTNPWANPFFKKAIESYTRFYGVSLSGYEQKEISPW